MFRIVCDYDLERLGRKLAAELSKPRSDPFERDVVVCQNRTMELYLDKLVADLSGIAAGTDYQYPRGAVFNTLIAGGVPGASIRFSSETLQWRIYSKLPELEGKHREIASYVEHHVGSRDRRRYQLAREIASVFDYYVGYRGDWLEAWSDGRPSDGPSSLDLGRRGEWQRELWLWLTESTGIPFKRVQRLLSFHRDSIAEHAPKRLSIFGISNLPPDYLDFFAGLARDIGVEVDLYYLTPCVEYWCDSTRRSSALEGTGNSLLGSFGTLGRHFFQALLERFENEISGGSAEFPELDETDGGTVLKALRQDILRDTPASESALAGMCADASLSVSCCHSESREVEVVRDRVLELLQEDGLEIDGILVAAPNIAVYAPHIEAVFGNPPEGIARVPFRISQRSLLETSPAAAGFMNILRFPESSATAEDVFEILSNETVANRLDFSSVELSMARELILDANIFWGENASRRRERLGFDYTEQGSWEFGFRRILSGYAFDIDTVSDDGVAPLPLCSERISVAGKLAKFLSLLFKAAHRLSSSRRADAWREELLWLVSEFERVPGKGRDERVEDVAAAVEELSREWDDAGMAEEEIPLSVVSLAMEEALGPNEKRGGTGFLRGTLTFCDLATARCIPFDAICVLGLNEDKFPRKDPRRGFDLSQLSPRSGDRSPRKEDAYLFIETIMACRGKLHLSYIGRDKSDNGEIPPSIVLDELLDYLETASGTRREDFAIEHPLHCFDSRCFSPSFPLQSYSSSDLEVAETRMKSNPDGTLPAFCPRPLELDSENDLLEFAFDDFIRFFQGPSRFFLRRRLGIGTFREDETPLPVSESFSLDSLERYGIKDEALERLLRKEKLDGFITRKKAEGALPPGIWGDIALDSCRADVEKLGDAIVGFGRVLPPREIKRLEFDIDGAKLLLEGHFDNLYENGMLFPRVGTLRDKHKLAAWIWHLLASQAKPEGWNGKTFMVEMKQGDLTFHEVLDIPVPDLKRPARNDGEEEGERKSTDPREDEIAAGHAASLRRLAGIFLRGLREPLPLFPESSFEFVKRKHNRTTPVDEFTATRYAAAKWRKLYNDYGFDLQDDAHRICFGESPPSLDPRHANEFVQLAESVCLPVANHIVKLQDPPFEKPDDKDADNATVDLNTRDS